MSAEVMRVWRLKPANRAAERRRRREQYSPSRAREYRLRYEAKNRESVLNRRREKYDPIASRAWHIRAKYGVSLLGWLALFHFQDQRCACCGAREPGGKRWHTDHDHNKTEPHIRGIVCHHCNLMLGAARDSTDRLLLGIRYLQRSS